MMLNDLTSLAYPVKLHALTSPVEGCTEVSSSHLSPLSDQTSPTSTQTTAMMASPEQAMEPADFELNPLEGFMWRDIDLNSNTMGMTLPGAPLLQVKKEAGADTPFPDIFMKGMRNFTIF